MHPERSRQVGRIYVGAVCLLGGVLLAAAVGDAARTGGNYWWLLLAGLIWSTGSLSIRVPAGTIYVSETFVFALILLYGPGPAVIALALDGLLVSLRHEHRDLRHALFNVAEPAVTVTAASTAFFTTAGIPPLRLLASAPAAAELLLPTVMMAGTYFLCNSVLTVFAISTEIGIPPVRTWRLHASSLALNSLGGACLGLVLAVQAPGAQLRDIAGGLAIVVPLLAITYRMLRSSTERMEDANRHLEELNALHLSTIETLAAAIDAKDEGTHGHIRRVQTYATRLATALGVSEPQEVKAIQAAALLHDIGKLSVPDSILNKPGRLTPAEYERMKLHAAAGATILSQVRFPYPVVPIVRHHHENWDGTGYPDGLQGDAIPLGARIMAVVDCYDALTSDRPYRRALTRDAALAILGSRRSRMYDPRVIDAFVAIHRELATTPIEIPELPGLVHASDQLSEALAVPGAAAANREPAALGESAVLTRLA
jgi:putative nucleotidyltransferase with HDIG domain